MLYDTFAELDRELARLSSLLPGPAESSRRVPTDVRRETDRYVVEMDLPGVDPSSIDVTLEDGALTVRAERSQSHERRDDDWVVRERSHAAVVRRFDVGDTVDPDAVTAHFADGVLTLSLPLAEQAKPRRIAVGGTSGPRELRAGSGTSDAAAEGADAGKAPAAHSATY